MIIGTLANFNPIKKLKLLIVKIAQISYKFDKSIKFNSW